MGWVNIYDAPPAALEMSQFLAAATTWTGLEVLRLMSLGAPINFGAVTQVLLANQRIRSMFLASDEVPTPDEHPAPDPQTDPALLCKATHASGVQLRSACLREALKQHIRSNDSERCRALINTMVHTRLDLLPADKAQVVALARVRGRLNLLPTGYAG